MLKSTCVLLVTATAVALPLRAQPQPTGAALEGKIKQLVAQLAARDDANHLAAEWALLKLGPDILPLLPSPAAKDQSIAAQRLRTIRATLQAVEPRRFTYQARNVEVAAVLKELTKQTGMTVVDRRSAQAVTPIGEFQSEKATFWEALDQLAVLAQARVALYEPDGNLALVSNPAQQGAPARAPVSCAGMFRTMLKAIRTHRDLETDARTCVAHLEVAWEPRLQPFLVEIGPASLRFSKDATGKTATHALPGRGSLSVTGKNAVDVELRVPAPARSAAQLESLQGHCTVIGPSKMLTFTFDKLKPLSPSNKPLTQTQEQVRVSLSEIATDTDRWTVEVTIDNPPGGLVFESFQSWLVNNAIYLEKGAGNKKQRLLPSLADEEVIKETRTADHAIIRYHFLHKHHKEVKFGNIADWTLVYRTPGRMVELTVPYAFKDVPLP